MSALVSKWLLESDSTSEIWKATSKLAMSLLTVLPVGGDEDNGTASSSSGSWAVACGSSADGSVRRLVHTAYETQKLNEFVMAA